MLALLPACATIVNGSSQNVTVVTVPSFGPATFGNIIAGGVIGVVVDAASGANYSYPENVRLDLAANIVPGLPPVALQDSDVAPRGAPARPDRRPARSRAINASTATGIRPPDDLPQ